VTIVSAGGGGLRRILVMDNAPGIELSYRRLFDEQWLAPQYMLVGFASNGVLAQVLFRSKQPDAVLLDLRGDQNIWEGIHTGLILKKENGQIKIVIMTSTDANSLTVACEAAFHGFEFISKDSFWNPRIARLYLDLLFEDHILPWPPSTRHILISQYRKENLMEYSTNSEISKKRANTEWLPSKIMVQLLNSYDSDSTMTIRQIAESLHVLEDTLRTYHKRLRAQLTSLGYDIPLDESGRVAMVEAAKNEGWL
jgi:CheY-like chemotaxis protein